MYLYRCKNELSNAYASRAIIENSIHKRDAKKCADFFFFQIKSHSYITNTERIHIIIYYTKYTHIYRCALYNYFSFFYSIDVHLSDFVSLQVLTSVSLLGSFEVSFDLDFQFQLLFIRSTL